MSRFTSRSSTCLSIAFHYHHWLLHRAKSRETIKLPRKENFLQRMLFMMVFIYPIVFYGHQWLCLNINYNSYVALFYHLHLLESYFAMVSTFYKPILYIKSDSQFNKEFKVLMNCYKSTQAETYNLHANEAL